VGGGLPVGDILKVRAVRWRWYRRSVEGSARCRFLMCVPTWRRLLVLLLVVVRADAVWCQLFVRYGLLFNLGTTEKVAFLTFAGYIKRGKSNY